MYSAITGHISSNLWLWTGIGLAVSVLGILAQNSLGKGFYTGEIIAVAGMFAGTTMIMISQRGMPQPVDSDDDAD
ncbi:MAG: hypothetical protein ACOYOH_25725 [Paracraurococcus sp.]